MKHLFPIWSWGLKGKRSGLSQKVWSIPVWECTYRSKSLYMSIGQGALISSSSYLRNAKGSDLLNIKKVKDCLRAQELWISPQKLRRRLVLGLNPNSYRELSVSTGKLSEKDFRLSAFCEFLFRTVFDKDYLRLPYYKQKEWSQSFVRFLFYWKITVKSMIQKVFRNSLQKV